MLLAMYVKYVLVSGLFQGFFVVVFAIVNVKKLHHEFLCGLHKVQTCTLIGQW